jgi:3-hydroxybutyryl-CoA dehydrogenase
MVADIQANRLPRSPQPENRQPDNRQPDNHQSGHDAAKIRTIGVIGAGIMGRGIAHVAALGGYRTILEDLLPGALRRAETEIRSNLEKAVTLGKVDAKAASGAVERLEFAQSVEQAAREADLVIEAVPEELESKVEIFTLLDKICRPHTILASNTSSLSITEIASVTYRAKQCIGMHFFNPVHKMKLIEVIRALETDDATVAAAVEVGRCMNKEVVVIKESPGFITSRMNALIGNEAFYMLQEGLASASDIDKALKLGLNHPMGPFELVDLVGLDTRLHILEYLHNTLGEKYHPAPLLVEYVKAGRLGRKAGRGVYEYPEQQSSSAEVKVAAKDPVKT